MKLNELTKAKVKYFFDNKIKVHIFRTNGFFHNGLILEYVEDYLIIDDKRNGSTPIYFIEIKEIEKMEEKE